MARRLVLVGFAVLVMPGTVLQLVIAFLVALGYLVVQFRASPYKHNSDDILASTCHVPAGGGVGYGAACGGVSGATLSVRADAGCAIEDGTPGVVPAGAYGADELDLLALYFAAVKVISMITMRLSYDDLPRMASTPPSLYGRCSS